MLIDDARQKRKLSVMKQKKQGYLEGQNTLEQEYNQKKTAVRTGTTAEKIQLQNSYQENKNMEKELVDVILNVFNKVFHIQFDDKKEILASSDR